MKLVRCLALLLLFLPASPAFALDPTRSIQQYKHSRWNWDAGVPAPIFSIGQGHDGYLWLGAGDGLYRFDAIRFEKIEVEGGTATHGSAMQVLVAHNGDVWTWFARSGRFAVYREGTLRLVAAPEVDGQVTRMVQAPDGAIWAGIGQVGRPLLRFHKGRWESIGAERGLPRDQLLGLVAAEDGAIWVSHINSVHRLAPGAQRFEQMLATPGASGTLASDRHGRIWLTDKLGTRPITGSGGHGPPPKLRFAYPADPGQRRGRPTFDRDGNLWVASRSEGIARVRLPDPTGAVSAAAAAAQVDRYRAADGLTSDRTIRAFEDREGNIWVATSLGLDRFRPANIAIEPLLTKPASYGDVLLGASDGSVYVGQADSVYRIAPGGRPVPFLTRTGEPEALCEASDGTVWIVLADRIVGNRGGRIVRTLSRPTGETGVYDCAFDRNGTVLVTAAESGMFGYRAGGWSPISDPAGRAGFHPTKLIGDARQGLILQSHPATISRIGPSRTEWIAFGDEKSAIGAFLDTPHGLLVTGSFGLARIRNGRAQILPAARVPALRRAEGLVQTPQGDIWAMLNPGVVRTTTRELDKAFSEPGHTPATTMLDFHDGLPDRPIGEIGRGMVRGGDGRIWLATLAGTVWFDPARIARNSVPPGVVISTLTADGKRHRDPRTLSLPAGTVSFQIDFAALSLTVPELNQVRYRLEGVDRDWIDPGMRRQAFYTNLPPGRYRFQVIAANDDGAWNYTGATVEFELPPTFLQSPWFAALCALATLAAAWLLFQLRLRQLTGRIRQRLEERLSEREHIARELHDTLLQSVQGLILRFQAVANNLPERAPARQRIEDALERAENVLVEARDSVRVLRVRDNPGNLEQLIAAIVADTLDPAMPVRIVVEGNPRPLHPLAVAEISRIAREALFNVARHAQARSVEIGINFGTQQLGIRIRDDGAGIPDAILARGHLKGHYGLPGMRERAEKLGGALAIESVAGTGTEVTLTTPAKLAYATAERRLFPGFAWPPFRRPDR